MYVYSTELGIRLSFVKYSEFRGGLTLKSPSGRHCKHMVLLSALKINYFKTDSEL
jgi:hypothetical protein